MNEQWSSLRSVMCSIRSQCKSTNMLIGISIGFLVLFAETAQATIDTLMSNGTGWNDAYLFNIAIHFGYYIYACPLICAFAGGSVFCNAMEAGFYQRALAKCGRHRLGNTLWFSGTFCGGISLAASILIFTLYQMLVFGPCEDARILASVDAWQNMLSLPLGGFFYMITHAILAFIFGAVWSGISLVFSVIQPNRYVCYFTPFVLCICATAILPSCFQPLEMLVQMRWTTFTFGKLFLYQGVLYLSGYSVFRQLLKQEVA